MKPVLQCVLLLGLALVGTASAQQCTFYNGTPATVTFGAYNPSNPTSWVGTISVWCTGAGTSVPVSITPVTGRIMTRGGGGSLNYNIYTDATHTTVWGDGTNGTVVRNVPLTCLWLWCWGTVNIYGDIPVAQAVRPGNYTHNSLTATVSGDSATFSATATVNTGCGISAAGTMDFGNLGLGFMTTDKTGVSATISYSCTSGLPATITLGQGQNPATGSTDAAPRRRMRLGATADYISYNLCKDGACNVVWGNTAATGMNTVGTGSGQSATVYGKATHANLPAGTYSDVVVVTVSF